MTLTMPRAQNDRSPSPETYAHSWIAQHDPSMVAYTCICASCQIVTHFWSNVSTIYLILIITLFKSKFFVLSEICVCVCMYINNSTSAILPVGRSVMVLTDVY